VKRIRETSIEVYHQVRSEGLLSQRRFQVYRTLFKKGPLTQMETSHQIAGCLDHSITPRFAELKDLGCIVEVAKRKCKITGRRVFAWDVTAQLPKGRIQRITKAEKKKYIIKN
jgi:hypothetical protein